MSSTDVAAVEESLVRETLSGLLKDFREHAEVVFEAHREFESADMESDRFDQSIAQLDAALTALRVTVPAILVELDRLDEVN